jgi:hypothetical protein
MASVWVSSPIEVPKLSMNAMTRSSFLEGLGTALSAAKCCHSALGSMLLKSMIKEILDIVEN